MATTDSAAQAVNQIVSSSADSGGVAVSCRMLSQPFRGTSFASDNYPKSTALERSEGWSRWSAATATARCVSTPYQEEHRRGGSQPEGCCRCREEAVKRHRRHRLTRLSRVDHMSGATRGYARRAAADSTASGSGFICPPACVCLRYQVRPAQGTTGVQGEHHGGPCRQVKQ